MINLNKKPSLKIQTNLTILELIIFIFVSTVILFFIFKALQSIAGNDGFSIKVKGEELISINKIDPQ